MKLSIGFSTCPNDTFIFDAMVNQKIDTEGIEYVPVIADIEELNDRALAMSYDITKMSFFAFGFVIDQYAVLPYGNALGHGVGPLLVAREPMSEEQINKARIAIPGKHTTANFMLSLAYPKAKDKTPMLFSSIEDAVLKGKADVGLLIHENRFTYADKGLVKLADLGEYWEKEMNMPIPLGGIGIRRFLPKSIQEKVLRALKNSIEYAFKNPEDSETFVKRYADTPDPEVIKKHIELYVNESTRELDTTGREAIRTLFKKAREKELIPPYVPSIFYDEQ